MLGDDKYEARLGKIEGEVQGMRTGQQAFREHVDHGFTEVKALIRHGQQDTPISTVVWAIFMLAVSNVMIALVTVIFLFDYYYIP